MLTTRRFFPSCSSLLSKIYWFDAEKQAVFNVESGKSDPLDGYVGYLLNGCFDLLHLGHLAMIDRIGGVTIALNSDISVRKLKGPGRPIQDELTRAVALASMDAVKEVILFEEETPQKLIEFLQPHTIVKGRQYEGQRVVGSDIAAVEFVDMVEGVSTTEIIERCRRES
jgi:D-beta-D-heptose 7-phosphate kinase/D-beta-D-heptose 1-phosphate adenosyltransferase